MTKAEIRKTATLERKALSDDQLHDLSTQLLQHFSTLDLTHIGVIHIFLPIEQKKEPNTFLIIDWLKQHHPEIKVIVPRADFDTALMTHHDYPGAEGLERNLFNILEPQNINLHTGKIDMVLIPLLAFDLSGYRVGYGKGFYDRFLSGHTAQKVGLSLFEPLDEISDIDAYDVKMDLCLTPERIYRFS